MLPLLLLSRLAGAAAWIEPPGEAYTKVWVRSIGGDRAVLSEGGMARLDRAYQDHCANLYAEVGLAPGWTAVLLSTPVGWAKVGEESGAYSGLSEGGLRRGIAQGRLHSAVELRLGGTPGGPRLGEGEVAGEPWLWRSALPGGRADGELQLGGGLGRLWLVGTAGGAIFFASAQDPALEGSLQLGGPLGERWLLMGTVAAWWPLGPVAPLNVSGAGPTRYVGLNLGAARRLSGPWSVEGGVGGGLYVESNAASPAITLGLSRKGPLTGAPGPG